MTDFFTAIPAIIQGIICFGIFMFLIFGLISKISGTSIRNTGIVSGGDTIVDPTTLDDVAKGFRKLVDKKYRLRKKIEEEYTLELDFTLSEIDKLIYFIMSLENTNSEIGRGLIRYHKRSNSEDELLKYLGITNVYLFNISNLTIAEKQKFDKIRIDLYLSKETIKEELKKKYDDKFNEMSKYL